MKSYGRALLKDGYWLVKAEPHVAMRLKRLFGRIGKSKVGVLKLRATDEVARDLLWFCQRYPLEVKPLDALERAAKRFDDDTEAFDKLISGAAQPMHFDLAIPARDYQRVAAEAMLRARGLLLGDQVGLGKSCSAICAMTDPRTRPALVVTLTALPRQWQREIKRFCPQLRTHIIKKATPYDVRIGASPKGKHGPHWKGDGLFEPEFPDVLIINYSKLAGWADALAGKVASVWFDEGQELRRAGDKGKPSAKYEAAKLIASQASFRAALTGTPIYNFGEEFYNLIAILRPEALGTREEFKTEWCTHGSYDGKARIADPKAFGSYLRDSGLMLLRTRADVKRELPPLQRVMHQCELDEDVLDAETDKASELARIILAKESGFTDKGQATRELDWRLRQATGVAKCLATGTMVMMHDGTTEAVEHLRPGDLLMGPDGASRTIMETTDGYGEMYEISSASKLPLFMPYVVNADHVLALKHTGLVRHGDRYLFSPYLRGDHLEITVKDYITKSRHFRHMTKGYTSGVDFPSRPLPLDPYFVGLWLGDGTSSGSAITTADHEIVDYLHALSSAHGLHITIHQRERTAPTYHLSSAVHGNSRGDPNPLRTALRRLGLLGNKHIPQEYLINSREHRMSLLAGLLDSDGHLDCPGCYTIATRWSHLAGEIARLAKSLGLAAKSRPIVARNQSGKSYRAYRISICGNGLEQLPMLIPRKRSPARKQIKDPVRSAIRVTPVGLGHYHGFMLDGDGLFLLHDFVVTHNSGHVAAFVTLLIESGEKVVLYGWHRAVFSLWLERLKLYNPLMFTGSESAVAKDRNKELFCNGDSRVLIVSLRAGAGLDGLQYASRICVFGELDWSYGVHVQCEGRVFRDGQPDPVTAYYLVADSGSDPFVSETVGLKRAQLEGALHVGETDGVVQQSDMSAGIKRMAERYLAMKSRAPAPAPVADMPPAQHASAGRPLGWLSDGERA